MMLDTLDAELETEILIAGVQDAASKFIRKGYRPGALVVLASPRTVREKNLVERLGHILDVKEAPINTGDLVVCPLDDAEDLIRSAVPEVN